MTNNEMKFWANMLMASPQARAVNPVADWGAPVGPAMEPKSYIYACDLATGWGGACTTPPENLLESQKLLSVSQSKQQAARNFAQAELIALADANEPSNTQLMQRGMTMAMYYIAQTQTLKIVQRQYGQISGHWLALIYRFTDGASTMRPVFISPKGHRGLMQPEHVLNWALESVTDDQQREDSELSRQLRSGREMCLAEHLQQQMRQLFDGRETI